MRQRLGIAQAIAGNPRLIIVDEPTAGLDPEERLRFYRLLSELAADRIVLLSTHIVEDVAVLCPRFAMIRGGRLIAYTTPAEARESIKGTIPEATISAEGYHELLADPGRCVTQAYLFEGSNRVRIYQPEGQPPAGFVAAPATLEDAYMVAIKTGRLPGPDHAPAHIPGAAAAAPVANGTALRSAIAERGDR
jgi:ABC-type multidrug transport system ATPase subunit